MSRLARGKPLSRPVLVGGTLQSPWVVGPLGLAGLAVVVAVLIFFRSEAPHVAVWFVLAALPLAALGLLAASVQLLNRRWLEVTADGFVVTRRDGTRVGYDDEQVIALSQRTTTLGDGSTRRRVVVEVAGGDSVDCVYHVPVNTADPLQSFFERNLQGLARRTADGGRLSGAGWHYDADGLHVHHGANRGTYTPDELTYIAFFGGRVLVWRGIEDAPLFSIADTSRNAPVLGHLLWEPMKGRPTLNDPLPGRPLGRRMYTVRGWDGGLGWGLIAVFGAAAAGFGVSFQRHEETVWLALAGLSLLLVGVGVWCVLRASYLRLDYHQFGVAQPGRGRSLLFADLGSMRWVDSDILLEPLPGADARPIRFHSVGITLTTDLRTIRDYLSQVIAQRWWQQMRAEPVKWTGALRFLPDKLEYRPDGLFGKGEPFAVPYAITSYYLVNTWMELFVQGQPKAVLRQPINAKNFWPGLTLLNWIYASMEQKPADGPKPAAPPKRPDERFTGDGRGVKPGAAE